MDLKALLMPCNARHVSLPKLSSGATSWTASNPSNKVVRVSHSINDDNIEKVVGFPTVTHVPERVCRKYAFELRVEIDCPVDPVFVVPHRENHPGFVLLLAILSLLFVVIPERLQ
jgi:hypothetical protein